MKTFNEFKKIIFGIIIIFLANNGLAAITNLSAPNLIGVDSSKSTIDLSD